jgi:GNAT superfamily N-acetyltransferase
MRCASHVPGGSSRTATSTSGCWQQPRRPYLSLGRSELLFAIEAGAGGPRFEHRSRGTVPVIVEREIQGLSDVLIDCVQSGASVSFMPLMSRGNAAAYWQGVSASVARGERVVLTAEDATGATVDTAQVVLAEPENQLHRGDIAKMLVHRRGRRQGLGAALLAAAERSALEARQNARGPRYGQCRGRALICTARLAAVQAHSRFRALALRHCATTISSSSCTTATAVHRVLKLARAPRDPLPKAVSILLRAIVDLRGNSCEPAQLLLHAGPWRLPVRKRRSCRNAVLSAVVVLLAECALVACSVQPRRSEAERSADASIAAQVQAALLADPNIYARHIEVAVDRGVVQLGGFVWSNQEYLLARNDAASVPGVKSVDAQMDLARGGISGTGH